MKATVAACARSLDMLKAEGELQALAAHRRTSRVWPSACGPPSETRLQPRGHHGEGHVFTDLVGGHDRLQVEIAAEHGKRCTSAGCPCTTIGLPSTSTAMCRFRPLIFLPASYPEGPPLSVVFTD